MTYELAKKEAEKEIEDMISAYRKLWPHGCAILVGSSLVGNKDGDSARFWYLKEKYGI